MVSKIKVTKSNLKPEVTWCSRSMRQYIANQKHETNRLAMYATIMFGANFHRWLSYFKVSKQLLLPLLSLQTSSQERRKSWKMDWKRKNAISRATIKIILGTYKRCVRVSFLHIWLERSCSIAHFRFFTLHFLFFFWTFLFGDENTWSVTRLNVDK